MALNVLGYFAEGENSAISRRMARGEDSERRAEDCGRGAGGGSRNAGLVRTPRAWFIGFNPGPSPRRLAPAAAPCHDVLEAKGDRRVRPKCLKDLFPLNKES